MTNVRTSTICIACGLILLLAYPTTALGDDEKPKHTGPAVVPVQIGTQWGYICSSGKLVIPVQFDFAGPFSEGLAYVLSVWWSDGGSAHFRGRYIEPAGRTVIEGPFRRGESFVDGKAVVQLNGDKRRTAVIDRQGKYLLGPLEDALYGPVVDNTVVLWRDFNKQGLISLDGEIIIPPKYSHVAPMSDGMILVVGPDGSGFADRNGEIAIKPRYIEATSFTEGYAWCVYQPPVEESRVVVGEDGQVILPGYKEGYIDKQGVFQIRDVPDGQPFSEGLAAVPSRGQYINHKGTVVLSGFADCMSFAEARAGAKSAESGKWGFINRKGEWVIKPLWSKVESFRLGVAKVWFSDTVWGYINMGGDVIWRLPGVEAESDE